MSTSGDKNNMAVSEKALSLLKRLGLNQYESRIYTSLLSAGSVTAGDLAERSNVPRSRVYDVLTSLEKKGFATVQIGRPVKYVGVPPSNAIKRVKSFHEEEYRRIIDGYDNVEGDLKKELSSFLDQKSESIDVAGMIGLLRGKVNIYNQIKQLMDESEKHIIKVTNHDGVSRLEKHCRSALEGAKKRGVKARIITNSDKGISLKNFARVRKANIDGRFFVSDNKQAIVVTHNDESNADIGLWIKSPYMATYLASLFDHAWENGKDI